jgi:hypothetical protein
MASAVAALSHFCRDFEPFELPVTRRLLAMLLTRTDVQDALAETQTDSSDVRRVRSQGVIT